MEEMSNIIVLQVKLSIVFQFKSSRKQMPRQSQKNKRFIGENACKNLQSLGKSFRACCRTNTWGKKRIVQEFKDCHAASIWAKAGPEHGLPIRGALQWVKRVQFQYLHYPVISQQQFRESHLGENPEVNPADECYLMPFLIVGSLLKRDQSAVSEVFALPLPK